MWAHCLPAFHTPHLALIMYSMPKHSPEELVLQHCHFPTSRRRQIKADLYHCVTVFDDATIWTALGKSLECLEDLILAAWAILLRSYLRNDTVTFAVFSEDQPCCDQKISNGTALRANTEAIVLQYEVADQCQVKDIHATACWKSNREVLETAHINTAVNLLAPSLLKNGMRTANLARLTGLKPVNHCLL